MEKVFCRPEADQAPPVSKESVGSLVQAMIRVLNTRADYLSTHGITPPNKEKITKPLKPGKIQETAEALRVAGETVEEVILYSGMRPNEIADLFNIPYDEAKALLKRVGADWKSLPPSKKRFSQRVKSPKLEELRQPGESLRQFIIRMRMRPAALANLLGLNFQTVCGWFRKFGIDYQNWPKSRKQRLYKKMTDEQRREKYKAQLKAVFGRPVEAVYEEAVRRGWSLKTLAYEYGVGDKYLWIAKRMYFLGLVPKIREQFLRIYQQAAEEGIIDQLTSEFERIILQKYLFEKKNYKQIAEELGLTFKEVKNTIKRMINRLDKHCLRKDQNPLALLQAFLLGQTNQSQATRIIRMLIRGGITSIEDLKQWLKGDNGRKIRGLGPKTLALISTFFKQE
ncbi:MAG: hypothetical protein QHH09_00510 [Microgenomates group bacterium]|nr:hypothetical protein [Microgenomates group bacterium]